MAAPLPHGSRATPIAFVSERSDRFLLDGEPDAAARIQRMTMPPARLVRPGLDLACHLDPARTVGGDFYDRFMLDERHLFFILADVSGKGAEASRFMVLSKTLWKGAALGTGPDLAAIQRTANAEIGRGNAALMFVTCTAGILDLETGTLEYSLAGHDAPLLFGPGRRPVQLPRFAGPPVGVADDADFPVGRCSLSPGDRICVFSDGVTEAMNGNGAFFGTGRLAAALADIAPVVDSAGIVRHVVASVERFAGDAEHSDDMTLMVISIPDAAVADVA